MNDGITTAPHGSPSYDDPTSTWMDLLAVAATPRRMAVLSTVSRSGELTITDLTARVVARVRGIPLADVTEEQYAETRAALHHSHLPALAERGLVEVRAEADATSVSPGPAFDAAHVDAVESLAGVGAIDPTLASALGDRRRRQIVSILSETDGAVRTDLLAETMAGSSTHSSTGQTAEALRLHHCDLPKLAEAGVVDYRPEERLVSYEGLPAAVEVVLAGG